ncbi:hypothetical protein Mycsm_03853 [Mycobacterium sp. JS623]|nr:hypothetical protein Mycsm_03853 [Mycobacterium sp. JS623]
MNFKNEFQSFDRLAPTKMSLGKRAVATAAITKDATAGRFSGRGAERQLHADERHQQ